MSVTELNHISLGLRSKLDFMELVSLTVNAGNSLRDTKLAQKIRSDLRTQRRLYRSLLGNKLESYEDLLQVRIDLHEFKAQGNHANVFQSLHALLEKTLLIEDGALRKEGFKSIAIALQTGNFGVLPQQHDAQQQIAQSKNALKALGHCRYLYAKVLPEPQILDLMDFYRLENERAELQKLSEKGAVSRAVQEQKLKNIAALQARLRTDKIKQEADYRCRFIAFPTPAKRPRVSLILDWLKAAAVSLTKPPKFPILVPLAPVRTLFKAAALFSGLMVPSGAELEISAATIGNHQAFKNGGKIALGLPASSRAASPFEPPVDGDTLVLYARNLDNLFPKAIAPMPSPPSRREISLDQIAP